MLPSHYEQRHIIAVHETLMSPSTSSPAKHKIPEILDNKTKKPARLIIGRLFINYLVQVIMIFPTTLFLHGSL